MLPSPSLIREQARRSAMPIVALLGLVASTLGVPDLASAGRVSSTEAETVCESWIASVVLVNGSWAGSPHPAITSADELVDADGTLLATCYTVSPDGFVVVPAVDVLPPVKMYAETGRLDVTATRGLVQLVRERLSAQVALHDRIQRRTDPSTPDAFDRWFPERNRDSWRRLSQAPSRVPSAPGDPAPELLGAGPLLTTAWHQGTPYDLLCPEGDGGRCVVGCVALAAAQVLNYHQWPDRGVGAHSYYWDGDHSCDGQSSGDTLRAVFSDPYDWSGSDLGVAELCYELGVAYGMSYGHCGSSSTVSKAVDVLPAHFKYSEALSYHSGVAYTSTDWFALIRSQIDRGLPTLYKYPGHALVCDGWRDLLGVQQIHLNYGWGGASTAWYAVDDIHGHEAGHESEGMAIDVIPDHSIIIDAQGSGDYPTLQAAIDAASPGDTVSVLPGTYTGDGNRDLRFRGKPITVRSRCGDPTECIIDAGGSEESPHRAVVFDAQEGPESRLEGISITGGWSSAFGGAVLCRDASPTIVGCVITGSVSEQAGSAIAVVSLSGPAGPLISGCTIRGNQGSAIGLTGGAAPVIEATLITETTDAPAISAGLGSAPVISCTDIWGNPDGDWTGPIAAQLELRGNLTENPLFCFSEDGTGSTLSSHSPCLPENNDCGVRIGALGSGCTELLVRPDGGGDWPTIQAAIDAAEPGDRVLLTDGISTGPGNRDVVVHDKVLTVVSAGDRTTTVIECSEPDEGDHRAFTVTGPGSRVTIEAITIQGGFMPDDDGGAIQSGWGAEVSVFDCMLRDNQARNGGAACVRDSARLRLVSCDLIRNLADTGGALHGSGAAILEVNHATFVENAADLGSAIAMDGDSLDVTFSILTYGEGGNAVACSGLTPDVRCSDVYGNAGGDWVDCLADLDGQQGNIHADPVFCPDIDDYTLHRDSPCLYPSAPVCSSGSDTYMGAHGEGCGGVGATVTISRPRPLRLGPITPRPFRSSGTIRFDVPAAGRVRLLIYDVAGRRVTTLLDGVMPAGATFAIWDGRDAGGGRVADGVYFACLRHEGRMRSEKLVLVR